MPALAQLKIVGSDCFLASMNWWSRAARQCALLGCRAGSGLPQVPVHTWWSAAPGRRASGPWQRDEAPVAAVLPGAALDQHDGRLLAHLPLQQGGGLQERGHRFASSACIRGPSSPCLLHFQPLQVRDRSHAGPC